MTVIPAEIDEEMVSYLLETYGDRFPAFFAREDLGWKSIGDAADGGESISREVLVRESRRARIMSVASPLIRRLVALKVAYIFGQGVTISASQEVGAEQDVNAVVQAFLDDPSNQATFSSQQAHEEMERSLQTEGNLFHALPTERATGRVQVRRIPFRQISDILYDPEDAESPMFFKREWTAVIIETGFTGLTTRSRRETRRELYPALGFRPGNRPKSIDGIPVNWETPVLHTRVNRIAESPWGTLDLLSVLPWAEGYEEFLQDWAKLIKALSRYAFRATSRGRNAATVRSRIESADPNAIGATLIQGQDQKFEAIGKSGATIDSESGRPLAAMVASGGDVPVTMLLGDPGVTGARATAETLDQPMQLGIKARQTLYTELFVKVLDYVVDQAVKAPQGSLKGTVRIDPVTRNEVIELANEQPRGIEVDWPSIEKVPLETMIKAIVEADGTNLLPELLVVKLLLIALDVDDVDEVLAGLVDPNTGEFVNPRASQASPTNLAGAAAAEAVRRGEDASEYV